VTENVYTLLHRVGPLLTLNHDARYHVFKKTSNLSSLRPSMWFQISAFAISHPGQRWVPPLVMYKDECMFVPYTNPHFWTDRNQTLHTSPPWSGRDRSACMGPQYFTFPTYFCRERVQIPAKQLAIDATLLRYCVISVMRRLPVWHHARWVAQWKGGEVNGIRVWKWKPDETGRKWLMNCTCNYIAFIQMIT